MAVKILLKRTGTPNKRPLLDSMEVGEVYINYDGVSGGLFYKSSDGIVTKVGPCQISTEQPNMFPQGQPGNSPGEFWFNPDTKALSLYDGTQWLSDIGAGPGNLQGVAPIVVDNETDPQVNVISVSAATVISPGVVQLTNSTSIDSELLALTAAGAKSLQDQINTLSITSNITLAGTLDASTGVIDSVTTEGAAAGFVVGSNLPAPAPSNAEYFVIITNPGTFTPTGGTPITVRSGDWILSNGTVWNYLEVGYRASSATTTNEGIVQLATSAEVTSGVNSTKAVVPSALQNKLSNNVNLNDASRIASSVAVKTANDNALQGISDAAAAQLAANTNTTNIGPLSNLQTSDKSSVVNAINEQETRLDLLANSLIYGGTYDASTNLVLSVTQAGTDAGLVPNNPLPTGAATTNVFVIVSVAGTGAPPAPVIYLDSGNWLVSNGTSWDYLQLGIPATVASLVAYTPTGNISATNVQDALDELDLEKVPDTRQVIAGNGLSGGGNLSSDVTLSLPNSGVTTGTYGSDGQTPQITVDTYGRITNIADIAASLGGLSDVDLATDPPVDLDVLQYVAADTEWQPKTLREATITSLSDLNATQQQIAFVSSSSGNDATGAVGDISRPYLTIKAALAAVSLNAPAVVLVGEGVYNEVNPLVVPAGVQIVGKTGTLGWVQTEIIPTVNTDDVIVMTGNGAGVTGVTVTVPTTAGKGAIVYDGPNGSTGSVTFTGIRGQTGSASVGIYCRCSTTGKIISFENRYRGGDMDSLLRVDGGILANESTHVPNTPVGGGPRVVFLQQNSLGAPISRLQAANSNSGNSNVQYVYETSGGTGVFFSVNWFQAANGVHITSNDYSVDIIGGLIDCATSVVVDNGLTGANGSLKINAQMNNSFEYPATWQSSDYSFEFNTKIDDPSAKFSSKVLQGTDLIIGESHNGGALYVGRGAPFKEEIKVLTSDATASATTDGGNITDVSAAAISKGGSTFTFQGTAANHCIYFGTTEQDDSGIPVKHTGLDLTISTGNLVGVYVVEIWNGTNWVEVGVQAVSDDEGYSYSNDLFWRSGSIEKLFYGIRSTTTWSLKAIGGFTCYWARIRVVTPPTAVPTFETSWLIPTASHNISTEGVLAKLGFSQYGVVNSQGSNIFTEQGTLVDYTFTMGPGGGNSYTHNIANVQIGSAGEGLFWQSAIVPGICTALPIYIDIGYSLSNTPTTAPIFNLYLTPIQTSGTLIADPSGGLTPIPRPQALTTPFTGAGSSNPALANISWPYTDANKLHRARFGPFDISDFYEGDALAIFLECVSNGTPTSPTNVWGVAIIGYQWTDGIRGY